MKKTFNYKTIMVENMETEDDKQRQRAIRRFYNDEINYFEQQKQQFEQKLEQQQKQSKQQIEQQ